MGSAPRKADQPRRAWLPYETVTTRVVWSVAAAVLVLSALYLSVGEPVIQPRVEYTAASYFRSVRDAGWGCLIPQVPPPSARYTLLHSFPIAAGLVWPLAVVPWKGWNWRVLSAALVFGLSAWTFVLAVPLLVRAPVVWFELLVIGGSGVRYIEWGPLGFIGNWTMFSGVVLFGVVWQSAAANRRLERLQSGVCAVCGYELAGIASGVCPECGHARLSAVPPRS